MNIHKALLKLATVSTLALAGANAHAAGGTVTAAGCYKDPTIAAGVFGIYKGSVYNNSTVGTLNVICPLTSTVFGSGVSVAFKAFDRDSFNNVSCTLYAESIITSGDIVEQSFPASTSGIDLGTFMTRTFGLSSLDANTGLYAKCLIPPQTTANWFNHLISFSITQ